MNEEQEEPKCRTCDRTGVSLTSDGICLACLARKCDEYGDDEGTWFSKA